MPYDGAVIIKTDIDTGPYSKGLAEMERQAKGFSGNMSSIFKGGLASLAGAFSLKEFATLSGTMTDLSSRAKIAAKGMADTGMIMERLRTIADRAYSPLEATANAFMNNSFALNSLGMSIEQQLDLTDALTNALVVSGAKGAQFEMVMSAVNRALATGVLNGQELEMVQKYGGAAAEALADHLGVTVSALKQMGAEGKLTADVIQEALVGNMEKFQAQADAMPATINDAFVRLRNQMLDTAGKMNKAFGIEQATVQAIDAVKEALAEYQGPMEEAITMGTFLFGTLLGGKAISAGRAFVLSKANIVRALAAETAAEKLSAAAKDKSMAASGRYATAAMKEAAARNVKAQADLSAAKMAMVQKAKEEVDAAALAQSRIAWESRRISQMAVDVKGTEAKARARVLLAANTQKLIAADNALAAAEGKLAAAQAAARKQAVLGAAALTGLRAAGSSLLSVFGGPLGLAMTGAAAATFYFATQESVAEKEAKSFGVSLEALAQHYERVAAGSGEAAQATAEFAAAQGRARQDIIKLAEQQKTAAEAALAQISNIQVFADTQRQLMSGAMVETGIYKEFESAIPAVQEYYDNYKKIIAAQKDGTLSAQDAADQMAALKAGMVALSQQEGVSETAIAQLDLLAATADRARVFLLGLVGVLSQVGKAEQLRFVAPDSQFGLAKYTEKMKDAKAETEKLYLETRENQKQVLENAFKAAQERYVLLGSNVTTELGAQAKAVMDKAEKDLADFTAGAAGSGGGAGRSFDDQKRSLEEIDLILAKLAGDFEKVKRIEANRELQDFIKLTREAGLSSAEAEAKIQQFQDTQANGIDTENLDTLIGFYDELRGMIPQAAARFDELNAKLIEQKANALLAAGAIPGLVEAWRRWQELQSSNEWEDGITRGALKFTSEWGNAANLAEKTFETMMGGIQDFGSGVVDAIFGDADFRADQFVKNLGKQLMQLAMNAMISQLLQKFMPGLFPTAHSGGIVGADVAAAGAPGKLVNPLVFAGAKKYHSGGIVGLASSEVPAILQRGEGVFTPAQMKALAPADSVNFKQDIKIVTPPGQAMSAETRNRRGPNGVMQTEIILRSLEDGLGNRIKTGESTLTPTLEGRYGLNNARGRHLRNG